MTAAGGAGGAATATASATSGTGDAIASAEAIGGEAGRGGDYVYARGGDATAQATAITGGDYAEAKAKVTASSGGTGEAIATATNNVMTHRESFVGGSGTAIAIAVPRKDGGGSNVGDGGVGMFDSFDLLDPGPGGRGHTLSFHGTFAHTGGVVSADSLTVEASGRYNLSGGVVNAWTLANLGTFDQSGGTVNAHALDNGGTYTLTGGDLNSPALTNTGTLDYRGGTLNANVVNNGSFVVGTGGASLTYDRTLSGTGTLTKNGTGTLTLSGANPFTGATTINAGTLKLGHTNALQNSTLNYASAGGTLSFGTLTGATLGGLSGDKNLALANDSSAAVALTVGGNGQATSYSGNLSGSGSLTKAGTGTLVLSGTNTYSGGTTVSAGTLQIGNGGTSGSVAGNIVDNASLLFNRSDSPTYAGVVSGTGSLTKTGSGTLVLTGNNTYTGGTTVSGGTLQVGNGGTAGAIAGNVTNNGTLAFNRSSALIYSGVISGTGSLVKLGTGTVSLTGANTYTGTTTISAGVLQVGFGNGATGSLATSAIANNGTLALSSSANSTLAANISGTGSILKVGNGTVTLTGTNTQSGTTSISGGGVRYPSASAVGGPGSHITISGTGRAILGYAIDQTFLDLLTAGSSSVIVEANSAHDLNLTSLPGLQLMAGGNVTLSGTITPPMVAFAAPDYQDPAKIYQLSGGTFGSSSLTVASAGLDSDARLFLSGTVAITGTNTISFPETFVALILDPGAGNSISLGGTVHDGIEGSGGTIRVASGTAYVSGDIKHYDNSYDFAFAKTGAGTLAVTGTLHAYVTVSEGTFASNGSFNGTLTNDSLVTTDLLGAAPLGGAYAQSSAGTLLVHLGSVTAYDQFTGGSASLAGSLDVVLVNGFTPADGDSFQILSFSSLSGAFDEPFNLPDLGAGLYWDTSDLYIGGTISVTDVPMFAPSGLSVVPEPAGLGLLVTGALALGARRRRARP